jgi:hypothetical protein
MKIIGRFLSLAVLASLAACAATPGAAPLPAPAKKRPAPPMGLERIMGSAAEGVTALLGRASLDRTEGPARQLQYIRPPCVLDVYLYPGPTGVPVVVTAAARKPDGSKIDPGACLRLITPVAVGVPR